MEAVRACRFALPRPWATSPAIGVRHGHKELSVRGEGSASLALDRAWLRGIHRTARADPRAVRRIKAERSDTRCRQGGAEVDGGRAGVDDYPDYRPWCGPPDSRPAPEGQAVPDRQSTLGDPGESL